MLLMLYAEENLDAWRRQIEASLGMAFAVLDRLSTTHMGGQEPFGFIDGVSQPHIDWSGEREPGTTADLDYGNLLTAGEFLLGYRNEYGLYTDRPLLDPDCQARRHCRSQKMIPHAAILAATAAIWCCASLPRMSGASGASSWPGSRRCGHRAGTGIGGPADVG